MSEKQIEKRQFGMNAKTAAAMAATTLLMLGASAKEFAHDGILWHYDVTDAGAVVRGVEPLPTEENGGDVAEETALLMGREHLAAGSVSTWPVDAWLQDAYFTGKYVIDIAK